MKVAFLVLGRVCMKSISIYSDESGVFDKDHEKYFVFGGLILFDNEIADCVRKYKALEEILRQKDSSYKEHKELKASNLKIADKRKAFSALNGYYKFGVIIRLNSVLSEIFNDKRSKQRYQDYAYKRAVKEALLGMINKNLLQESDEINFHFIVDQHHTATNGCYELKEGLLSELKNGTYNYHYAKFFPPIFPYTNKLELKFVDSQSNCLVRASDIIANRLYYEANHSNYFELKNFGRNHNLNYICLPR